jgi:UPF0755 protein
MSRRRTKRALLLLLAIASLLLFVGIKLAFEPTTSGPDVLVRYERNRSLRFVLQDLENRGIIRSAFALRVYASYNHRSKLVKAGSYRLHPGMTTEQIFDQLGSPLVVPVRFPDTNWAQRTANLLETKYHLCGASEYMGWVRNPGAFQDNVSFPLPKDSLEGYLYPDTYDLEPLMDARSIVLKQLKAFESQIWDRFGHPKNLTRLLNVASIVQLEAGPDADKPKIAGVIENRLAKKMRLQIDATILYGIQKWKRLSFADYSKLKTPYNTYLHSGLPPGPICSPNASSVDAALHPDRSGKYLFYLALPDGRTVFASTFAQHRKNIALRKQLVRPTERTKDTVAGSATGSTSGGANE